MERHLYSQPPCKPLTQGKITALVRTRWKTVLKQRELVLKWVGCFQCGFGMAPRSHTVSGIWHTASWENILNILSTKPLSSLSIPITCRKNAERVFYVQNRNNILKSVFKLDLRFIPGSYVKFIALAALFYFYLVHVFLISRTRWLLGSGNAYLVDRQQWRGVHSH